jgi:hypothetical protein
MLSWGELTTQIVYKQGQVIKAIDLWEKRVAEVKTSDYKDAESEELVPKNLNKESKTQLH